MFNDLFFLWDYKLHEGRDLVYLQKEFILVLNTMSGT